MREPDFGNLLAVLARKKPTRPTLYELFLNDKLYAKFAGFATAKPAGSVERWRMISSAMRAAGYDYAPDVANEFRFEKPAWTQKESFSLNEPHVVTDRESFRNYAWPDADAFDYSGLDKARDVLPAGMKLVVLGPCGVLENALQLVGFERLCLMLADDAKLAGDIFDAIGSRLLQYYRNCLRHDTVGAVVGNDDWGFKTQTMIAPKDMRKYVFPWHKRIVAAAHDAGRPAILHSCGNPRDILEDIIKDMEYDARHSYEDTIQPVEEAYEAYGDRIAILGGIDVDFLCRSTREAIKARCRGMLERSARRGGYALGSGNSVPEFVPEENYLAMTSVALEG
jgi:uroporphyrinogen decarboxylase